jgi:hypothetical protein
MSIWMILLIGYLIIAFFIAVAFYCACAMAARCDVIEHNALRNASQLQITQTKPKTAQLPRRPQPARSSYPQWSKTPHSVVNG